MIDEPRIHGHGDALDCPAARAQISARLDGELDDDGALRTHLARCGECVAHERALLALARDFAALRREEPASDLWPRIERRLRPRATPPVLLRMAAAAAGFAGLGGAALLIERGTDESGGPDGSARHLVERLSPPALGPDTLFAALPEYRLLRALPREETR